MPRDAPTATPSAGQRNAGIAGVLAFALVAIGAVVQGTWDFPPTDATAVEIAAYVSAERSALLVATLLYTSSVTLWLLFGAGVWTQLRDAAGAHNVTTACFAVGLVSLVTLVLAGFTVFLVLVYRDAAVADPRTLYDLAFGLLAMSGPPTALALGAYAIGVLRTGTLPRWTAWLAVLGAAAHVVLLASFVVPDGFFSLQGQVITVIPATLFAWILGTGIALARSGQSSRV